MSGPKIVDIRLVQAMQERQRRLAERRFQQVQKQWNAQRLRMQTALAAAGVMSNADDLKAIQQAIRAMDQRLAQLGEARSVEEVVNRGAEWLAFMDAELSRLQQHANDAVLEARLRARSMQAAVTDLAARLQAAGMEQDRQALLKAPTLDALERAAQLLERQEDQVQDDLAIQQALADLGVRAKAQQIKPEANDQERERIEQLLVHVELLDDGPSTTAFRARLDALDGEIDPRQRRLRLDSLALHISQALQRLQEAGNRQRILDDLEAQLAAYDEVPPGLIEAIAYQREGREGGATLAELQEAVARWCQQEARRLDGERIRTVVLGSLRELGYDVREGMATGWVEGDSVVLQKAGSQDYAVELQDMNGRLRSQVVRYGDPDSPLSDQQQQRDTEVEQHWCMAHARALESLRQQGIEADIKAKREPGEVPVVVVRRTEGTGLRRETGRGNLLNNQSRPEAR